MQIDLKSLGTAHQRLRSAIEQKFPKSGLAEIAANISAAMAISEVNHKKLTKVNWYHRLATFGVYFLVLLGIKTVFFYVKIKDEAMSLSDIFQGLDAVTNLAVASILSWWALWRMEQRRRDKLLGTYFSELVALAHVIDLHQLFKDPKGTEVKLSQQELYYYFDYCCDLLAILSKIGVIYGQEYREEAATKHVADLQELCSDLSRRIGQKIELLTITPEIQ